MLRQVVHGTRYIDEVVLEILEDGAAWVHQAEGDQGGSLKDWNVVALILDSPQRAWPAGRAATLPLRGTQRVKGRVLERNHQTPYGIITVDQETYWGDSDGDGKVTEAEWDTNTNGQLDSGDDCWGSNPSSDCRLVDFDFDDDVDSADATTLATLVSSTTYRRFGQPYSGVGNTRAHQGLIYDAEIQGYNNRARQYAPQLKRFMQRDPAHYHDGLSMYQSVGSNPLRHLDPSGYLKWHTVTKILPPIPGQVEVWDPDAPNHASPATVYLHKVQTDDETWVNIVWATEPRASENYNCHGYTFNGHAAMGGPYGIDDPRTDDGEFKTMLLEDNWKRIDCCHASIYIFWKEGQATHSGKFVDIKTKSVVPPGLDEDNTTVLAKRGWKYPFSGSPFAFKSEVQGYAAEECVRYKCYKQSEQPVTIDDCCLPQAKEAPR